MHDFPRPPIVAAGGPGAAPVLFRFTTTARWPSRLEREGADGRGQYRRASSNITYIDGKDTLICLRHTGPGKCAASTIT